MKIILQGTPKRRAKSNITRNIIHYIFGVLPLVLLAGACIMLIIHISRLNPNLLTALSQLIDDVFHTERGWLFANGKDLVSIYKESPIEYTFRMTLSAFILFMGGSVTNLQCPYCDHFFTLKRISENEYEGSTGRKISNTYDEYGDALSMDLRGNIYYTQIHTKNRQYGTEVTEHYTYKVRCSCCGCVALASTSKTHIIWD